MSKAPPPPSDFTIPPGAQGPPSYNQAVSEGAIPPGPAVYQPPITGPAPGAPYGPAPGAPYGPAPGATYGPAPGAPYVPAPGACPQGPVAGQYGLPPGQPLQQPQPQQYGQYGAPPGHAVPAVVVAPVQTVAMIGKRPTRMTCPHCHADIETTMNTSPSTTAWIAGLLILLFGCWMGCCLIPCCMDECMDKEHYCPNCKAFLGRYRN